MGTDSASRRERRWARLRRRVKVTFAENASFTVDLSEGGFCAQLLRVKQPGTSVEGTLLLKGTPLAYAGRVVWAQAGEARMGVPGRMGISFTRVEPSLQALLSDAGER